MAGTPWVKWYWSDWRSDPRLRMCSLAARGLWAEMLALMQEAVPYGHLLIAGRSPSSTQLAALAGAPSEQIPDLIAELGSACVFSRTKEGVIYSRRMVRDERKAKAARKNGLKGGNPTLCKNEGNFTSDTLEGLLAYLDHVGGPAGISGLSEERLALAFGTIAAFARARAS